MVLFIAHYYIMLKKEESNIVDPFIAFSNFTYIINKSWHDGSIFFVFIKTCVIKVIFMYFCIWVSKHDDHKIIHGHLTIDETLIGV